MKYIFLVLWYLFTPLAHVAAEENLLTASPQEISKIAEGQNVQWEALAQDSTALGRQQQELRVTSAEMPSKLQNLQINQITEAMVTQARLDTQTLKLREDEILTDNTNTAQQIKNLEQIIQKLKAQEQLLRNPAKTEVDGGNLAAQLKLNQDAIAQKQAALEFSRQHLTISQEWLNLTQKKRILAEQWQSKVEEYYRIQQEQNRQQAQQDLSTQLSRTRQTLLERADESRQRLQQDGGRLGDLHRLLLDINAQSAEEQAKLISLDEQIAKTDDSLERWQDLVENTKVMPKTLRENLLQLKNLYKTTDDLTILLDRRYQLFTQQREPLTGQKGLIESEENARMETLKVIDDLLNSIVIRRERLKQQVERLNHMAQQLNAAYEMRVKADFLTRQPWPWSVEDWKILFTGLAKVPSVIWHQIKLSVEATLKQAALASWTQWLLLVGGELVLATLSIIGPAALDRAEQRSRSQMAERTPITAWQMTRKLLRRNIRAIFLAAMIIIIPWGFQAPEPSLAIIATLVLMILLFKVQTNFVWLLWATPDPPLKRRLPGRYQQLISLLASVELLGTFTLLSHLSALQTSIIVAIDWLFMIYWLLMFWPLSQARKLLFKRLNKSFPSQFWPRYLRVFGLPLWLTLWGAALVGISGYLNLAWAIAVYWWVLVSLLIGWLILRELLDDLTAFSKNYAISHTNFGLLWAQEIITPLDWTLRILLTLGGIFLLLNLSGLGDLAANKMGWEHLLATIGAILFGYMLLLTLAGFVVERLGSTVGSMLIRHTRRPIGVILAGAVLRICLPWIGLSAEWQAWWLPLLVVAQIVGGAWLSNRLMSMVEEIVAQRYRLDTNDNLKSRRVQTQIQMLRRIVTITVYLIMISAILMTFPQARKIGTGLLASAGVAGLAAGVAARPILENLIAGIQIGLTQPIRLNDVVVVEGEWGRIEEIRATYVVVELWDKRHLVLPINYFITNPFENWTRTDSDLLGTVSFYVDYTFSVDEGRRELQRILTDCPFWDGQIWSLNVTSTSDRGMELRALISATDASSIWNLRCLVRERFVSFLQREYPDSLPKVRNAWDKSVSV